MVLHAAHAVLTCWHACWRVVFDELRESRILHKSCTQDRPDLDRPKEIDLTGGGAKPGSNKRASPSHKDQARVF